MRHSSVTASNISEPYKKQRCGVQKSASRQSGAISQIQHFSVHDGPGIRTTVFFKGCPLSCLWCHNPENQALQPVLMLYQRRCSGCRSCADACTSNAVYFEKEHACIDRNACRACGACVEVCPLGARALVGKTVTVDEVAAKVLKDKIFYDTSGGGVTFSGGEPLLQLKFLIALARQSKEHGIHTTLDTSGYAASQILLQALEFIDLVIFDIKLINPEKHRRFTGVDNALIFDNFLKVYERPIDMIARIPLIHEINDSPEDVAEFAEFFGNFHPRDNFRIELLPYHGFGEPKYDALGKPFCIKQGKITHAVIEGLLYTLRNMGFNITINCW